MYPSFFWVYLDCEAAFFRRQCRQTQTEMWGIGAIRDGAAGLVKQGAGAVRQGVEAGAKLLENLDEVGKNRFRHRQCFCWFRHVLYRLSRFRSVHIDVPARPVLL